MAKTVQADDLDAFVDDDAGTGLPATEAGNADYGDDDVLDLSGVDENQQYPVLPAGIYPALLDTAEYGRSQKGNPMITWTFKVHNEDTGRDQRVWQYSVLNEDGFPRLKRMLLRLQPGYDTSQFRPRTSPQDFVGLECRLRLRVQAGREGNGPRNQIADILPPDEGSSSFIE